MLKNDFWWKNLSMVSKLNLLSMIETFSEQNTEKMPQNVFFLKKSLKSFLKLKTLVIIVSA